MKRHITLLLLTLALPACGGDDGADTNQQGNNSTAGDCDDANAPTYETFGEAFFAQYCNDCHGSDGTHAIAGSARAVGVFDTVGQIQGKAEGIEKRAVLEASGATMMPPSYADAFPTEAERDQLALWLSCGAP